METEHQAGEEPHNTYNRYSTHLFRRPPEVQLLVGPVLPPPAGSKTGDARWYQPLLPAPRLPPPQPAVGEQGQQHSEEEVANVTEHVVEGRDGQGVADLHWVAAQCVVVAHVLIATDV